MKPRIILFLFLLLQGACSGIVPFVSGAAGNLVSESIIDRQLEKKEAQCGRRE